MQRRQFIAMASSALLYSGCKPRHPAELSITPEIKRTIVEQQSARQQHLATLEGFRVPTDAVRTTPPRVIDLLKEYPELRSRVRVSVRLHPRYSDEPKPQESKLGGSILWPAEEPWPVDEQSKLAYQPILQLRLEDAPAQVKFPPKKDLLQVLWVPREGSTLKVKLVWRSGIESLAALAELPSTEHAHTNLIPVPCRLFPERVPELPEVASLPQGELKTRLEAWKSPDANLGGAEYLHKYLNACPGTKIGGYPRKEATKDAVCERCRWPMDYTLTISGDDYGGDPRWAPSEETGRPGEGYAKATGLKLPGSGSCHIFVCRRCEGWPAQATA